MSVTEPTDSTISQARDRAAPPTAFLICAAGSQALTILYADADARRCLPGRALLGAPLASLFRDERAEESVARAQCLLARGGTAVCNFAVDDGLGGSRRLTIRLQPIIASDDGRARALCTLQPVEAGDRIAPPACSTLTATEPIVLDRQFGPARAAPTAPSPTSLDMVDFVETLADRLVWLLPGAVAVSVDRPQLGVAAAVAGDPLEELIAALLIEAVPPQRWRYTVRVTVTVDAETGAPMLRFAIPDAPLAACSPTADVAARMADLGIVWRPLQADTIALLLPSAPSAAVVAAHLPRRRSADGSIQPNPRAAAAAVGSVRA